jgi:hypothetical protein
LSKDDQEKLPKGLWFSLGGLPIAFSPSYLRSDGKAGVSVILAILITSALWRTPKLSEEFGQNINLHRLCPQIFFKK